MASSRVIRAVVALLIAALLPTILTLTLARRDSSGWIAYVSEQPRSIYLKTGLGVPIGPVNTTFTCVNELSWSPDGEWIAFADTCGGAAGSLLRIRPYRSRLEHVAIIGPVIEFKADWSPDGQQFLVSSNTRARIVNLDGDIRILTNEHSHAQWSPDGEWVYARLAEHTEERIHIETGTIESVRHFDERFSRLSWSPNADELVLTSAGDAADTLAIMEPDGDNFQRIWSDPSTPRLAQPQWSPDGEWIAFLGGSISPMMDVYRIRPDGSDLERLTYQTGLAQSLQWSPNSKWLAFTMLDRGDFTLFTIRADGTYGRNLGWGMIPQYAPVTGKAWHPALMTLVAVVILATSVVSSRVWQALV